MWVIVVIAAVAFVFITGIQPILYWRKRGVPTFNAYPYFGSVLWVKLRKRSMLDVVTDNYRTFSNKKYFGFFNMSSPVLMIRDPDLIKTIMATEFHAFPDHRQVVPEGVDPMWDRNLFAMKGDKKWHKTRANLTPMFTSNQLKFMFESISERSKRISNHLLDQNGLVEIELKDLFSRFASNVMATTIFGADYDCLNNKQNEFYLMGKAISNATGWRNWILTLYYLWPSLSKIIRFSFFPREASKFFKDLVQETIKEREEKQIMWPDIIHFLNEARKNGKLDITDDDITAQTMIGYSGGFDALTNMISFTLYELAVNPDVQKKLYNEVDAVLESFDRSITYEALSKMTFLKMVIKETLRMWPIFSFIDRRSAQSFTIENTDLSGKHLHLDKGTVCTVPVFSIHRDSKYYPDPEKFDPERFAETNEKNIKPFTYLPFGEGRRKCIGSRLALLVGELITAEIISKFEVVQTEKTEIPLVLSKKRNNAIPENGFWLGFKPRL